VYYSRGPIMDAGTDPAAAAPDEIRPQAPTRGGRGFGGFGGGSSVYQNTQPMATGVHLASYDPRASWPEEGSVKQLMADEGGSRAGGGATGGRGGFRGFGGGTPEGTLPGMRPRVILRFPAYAGDMLLTGGLENGQVLSNRAQLVDSPVGEGHMVLFAIRPFWRWQTQGTYILGFNAILNWNDLDAGQ
jgi:hypothetical protein